MPKINAQLNIQLDKLLSIDYDKIQQEVIQELYLKLEERTPVDTGKAKAGWFTTSNSIQNDVDYMYYLENGHSDQAPNGMVRITLEDAPDVINNAVQKEINK